MKRLLGVALCFCTLTATASHIVGGEFELLYQSKNNYKLRLIYYFDVAHSTFPNPEELEPTITVAIYRKSDNLLMDFVTLTFQTKERVPFRQEACVKADVVTDRLVYSADIFLSDAAYSHPDGYYVIWERCCRNYTISNIYSSAPGTGEETAGQTFYLEFSAIVKDGEPFVNSSPRLFAPLNTFACTQKEFFVRFSGIDDDDDSLVYSLVTPLNTHSSAANPPLDPAPYPEVTWKPPYSLNNILGGSPDMRIRTDGYLTVTPLVPGLFVFAVRCEEYRHGEKIGETRRDYQIFVTDDCDPAVKPVVKGKPFNSQEFVAEGDYDVLIPRNLSDDMRCMDIQVSDEDANTDGSEEIILTAVALNYKGDVTAILPEMTSVTLTPGMDSTIFRVCFSECPYTSGITSIAIVAEDNTCGSPLQDTLIVHLDHERNFPAYFQEPASVVVTDTIPGSTSRSWPIVALDGENDILDLAVVSELPDLSAYGITLDTTTRQNGEFRGTLRWDANCELYTFDRDDFRLKLLANDRDECDTPPDSLIFDLHVDLSVGERPWIETSLDQSQIESGIQREILDAVGFTVTGRDTDNNPLTLTMTPIGFSAAEYGALFPAATANDMVTSVFNWPLLCDKFNLSEKDEFQFVFKVTDSENTCRVSRSDSVIVTVMVLPPANTTPELSFTNLSPEAVFDGDSLHVTVGQAIVLRLSAEDADREPTDPLHLQLLSAEGTVDPSGYNFAAADGVGSVSSDFTWNPDCSIFENNVYRNRYIFSFIVTDNRCHFTQADTVAIPVTVADIDGSDTEFLPPNFITPNGDGCNDFFALDNPEVTGCGNVNNPHLPKDNCMGRFISIHIFNRWGREIFASSNRYFRWYAEDVAAGVYFYTMVYSDMEYKGSVTVMD